MRWAQRRKNRVDQHRKLGECREQLKIRDLSSFCARGASPITCDAELDSPASLAAQDSPDVQDGCGQDTPDPPVVQDAHDRKPRRRHVTPVMGR